MLMDKRQRKKLIKDLGGATKVSRLFAEKGVQVHRQSVDHWVEVGFPPERVRLMAEISGRQPAELHEIFEGMVYA